MKGVKTAGRKGRGSRADLESDGEDLAEQLRGVGNPGGQVLCSVNGVESLPTGPVSKGKREPWTGGQAKGNGEKGAQCRGQAWRGEPRDGKLCTARHTRPRTRGASGRHCHVMGSCHPEAASTLPISTLWAPVKIPSHREAASTLPISTLSAPTRLRLGPLWPPADVTQSIPTPPSQEPKAPRGSSHLFASPRPKPLWGRSRLFAFV